MPDPVERFSNIQKATLTSLPLSTTSQNVSYKCSSWYVVESPWMKPDWEAVKICAVYNSYKLYCFILHSGALRTFDIILSFLDP